MNNQLGWPRCCCGHIAQAHNRRLGQEPENYGCDECNCEEYRFPAQVPQERRDALNAQRKRILEDLDSRHGKACTCK